MKRILWPIGLLLVIIIAFSLTGCDGSFVSPPARTTYSGDIVSSQQTGIWVTGEGKVTVVPDVAILSLGVEAQATTVAQAQNEASTAMNAVINELKANDVAEKDIRTTRFSIYPVRKWDQIKEEEYLVGYRVSNMVTAKIRDVDATGIIIDAVTRAGGDFIRIDSIGFTVDDPTKYHEEAREMAIKDAEAKAKHLADTAGVDLGEPTFISESGGYVPTATVRMAYAEAIPAPAPAPPPISPGETEVTLTVQIAYNIK
jgi:uncharacterized protein YggE